MPNPWDPPWQPNRIDVRFDAAAAGNAIGALYKTAAEVEAITNERIGLADTARLYWSGRYRDEFDQRFDATTKVARQLTVDLRDAASKLQQAGVAAQQEQQARVQQRTRWDEEQATNLQQYQAQQLAAQQAQQQAAAAGAPHVS